MIPFVKGKTSLDKGVSHIPSGEEMSHETFEVICTLCNFDAQRVHIVARRLGYHYRVQEDDLQEFINLNLYYESYDDDVQENIIGLRLTILERAS